MSDHPAIQFKAGQEKGERYPCHGCYINMYLAKSIRLSFKRKTILLKPHSKDLFINFFTR